MTGETISPSRVIEKTWRATDRIVLSILTLPDLYLVEGLK